jgi:membrane protease subunit (stomatin/prohibitin family)
MGMGMNAAGGMMGGMQQPTEGTPQSQFIQQQPNMQQQAPPQQPEQPAQAAPAPAVEDVGTRLAKLQGLLDQGIITQEDFDSQRARILESI